MTTKFNNLRKTGIVIPRQDWTGWLCVEDVIRAHEFHQEIASCIYNILADNIMVDCRDKTSITKLSLLEDVVKAFNERIALAFNDKGYTAVFETLIPAFDDSGNLLLSEGNFDGECFISHLERGGNGVAKYKVDVDTVLEMTFDPPVRRRVERLRSRILNEEFKTRFPQEVKELLLAINSGGQ